MSRGWAEREGERTSSSLRGVSLDLVMGLYLMNHEIMARAEIKSWTLNQLRTPLLYLFKEQDFDCIDILY